jgi:DNA repair protein RecO (recombination protein O)
MGSGKNNRLHFRAYGSFELTKTDCVLLKTRAIVMKTTRYGETSLVCRLYTEEHGLVNGIISGVRKSRTKTSASVFFPLAVINLVMYYREGKHLKRIREAQPALLLREIPFLIPKSSLALFCTEVLSKCLKEEVANPALFSYLVHAIQHLDEAESAAVFHLEFLIGLAGFLGFGITNNHSSELGCFDLQQGNFTSIEAGSQHTDSSPASQMLARMLSGDVAVPREHRQALLHLLLQYYRLHVEGFGNLKSPAILTQVLSDPS